MASSSSSSTYPYPSEVNVRDFVAINLSHTNYNTWKAIVLGFIQTQDLVGFINGNISAPLETITVSDHSCASGNDQEIQNMDYHDFKRSDKTFRKKRSDELVRSWILETLNEDIFLQVARLKTAQDVWALLEEVFTEPETENVQKSQKEKDEYKLLEASIQGDWEKANTILEQHPEAVSSIIAGGHRALFAAVRSKRRFPFVSKLVKKTRTTDLGFVTNIGHTALHLAVLANNIEAAMLLVSRNPNLPNIWNNDMQLPLHLTTSFGKRELFLYLLEVTEADMEPKPFEGDSGVQLLCGLINNEFYDLALTFVRRHPELASWNTEPLETIAQKSSSFRSGARLNSWQRLIYTCSPTKLEKLTNQHSGGDIENPDDGFISVRQKKHSIFWEVIKTLVPQVKNIQETKLKHLQAMELVKLICEEIGKLDYSKAKLIFSVPLKTAVVYGNCEVAEKILSSSSEAIYLQDEPHQTIFHLAIAHRRENIFNLIHQYGEVGYNFLSMTDDEQNCGLHLAGYLDSQVKLNLRATAAGAALQMQREFLWFKEVEKFTLARDREGINDNGKTPKMLFTETHEDLVKEGEKWMKDTSTSCTIVAALIVTVVFAAAITVPGGNKGDGLPNFSKETGFRVFAISDALALFSSSSSLIMFLSILTSRYAEEDFLYALPKRLIIGLVTLFLSMIFMMTAFGAALFLVFGDKNAWIHTAVVPLACVPVILFASLQFPLLLAMIKSTYGSGIFGKKSDRMLY